MAPDICMESDNETFLTTHQKKKEDKIPCKYTAVLFFAAAQLAHQRTVPQTTTQPGIDRSIPGCYRGEGVPTTELSIDWQIYSCIVHNN